MTILTAADVPTATPHRVPETSRADVLAYVSEIARLTKPAAIHWCDGSQAERDTLITELIAREASAASVPPTAPAPITASLTSVTLRLITSGSGFWHPFHR